MTKWRERLRDMWDDSEYARWLLAMGCAFGVIVWLLYGCAAMGTCDLGAVERTKGPEGESTWYVSPAGSGGLRGAEVLDGRIGEVIVHDKRIIIRVREGGE